MNKQEVIDKLKKRLSLNAEIAGSSFDAGYNLGIKDAIATVVELDEPVKTPEPEPWEPEKPVVPQFVAEWLEVCKENLAISLAGSMNPNVLKTNNQPDKTIHWLAKNSETFAKAWIYGYEVEKEKLYTARLEVVTQKEYAFLNKEYSSGNIFIHDLRVPGDKYQVYFTQKELEELDVWNNPAFEVEEVDE